MRPIRALAASLHLLLGALAVTASASFAEVTGVRFEGPPLKLMMTVDVEERVFPAKGSAALAVVDGRDALVFKKEPIPYRVSKSQLRVEHPFPTAKVPFIRDRMRVTLVVNDRRGTPHTFRAAAANPKLPVTLVANAAPKALLMAQDDLGGRQGAPTQAGPPAKPNAENKELLGPKGEGATKGSAPAKNAPASKVEPPAKVGAEGKDPAAPKSDPGAKAGAEKSQSPPTQDPEAKRDGDTVPAKEEGTGKKGPEAKKGADTKAPAPRGRALLVHVTGPGNVTSTPAGIKCSERDNKGCEVAVTQESMRLTVTADPGYHVATGCTSGVTTCTVNVPLRPSGRTEFKVVFKPDAINNAEKVSLKLTLSIGGLIRVEGYGSCGETYCAYEIPRGERVSLVADPSSRFRMGSWGGACKDTKRGELRCVVTLDRTDAVNAVFERNPLVLLVTPSHGFVVTVDPRGDSSTGECRENCLVSYQQATSVKLQARRDEPGAAVEWWGCDERSGPVCKIMVDQEREISVGPPTLLGRLAAVLRAITPLRALVMGGAMLALVGVYAARRRRRTLGSARRRDFFAVGRRERREQPPGVYTPEGTRPSQPYGPPEPGSADATLPAKPGDAPVPVPLEEPSPVSLSANLRAILEDISRLPEVPRSATAAVSTRRATSAELADDAVKMVAAMNVSWDRDPAGQGPDRPALRERLRRLGVPGDFYDVTNLLDRLDTMSKLPYNFTPATTTGGWLLIQTSIPERWLTLPLAHTVTETAMVAVKRLFDGWDKLPQKYRFERAYRPCVLRRMPGAEFAFEVDEKGYFTLEGAPPTPPPPAAPPSYESLVDGGGPTDFRLAESTVSPLAAGKTKVSEWLNWLKGQVEEIRTEAAARSRMDANVSELRRQLAAQERRIVDLTALVERASTRPAPSPASQPYAPNVEPLFRGIDERLRALGQAESTLREELRRQDQALAGLRDSVQVLAGQAERPRESPTARDDDTVLDHVNERPGSPSSQTGLVSFVSRWLAQFSDTSDTNAVRDHDDYEGRLSRCLDSLQRAARTEAPLAQVDIVHLTLARGHLRLTEVSTDSRSVRRCSDCDTPAGRRPYQHFIAVRTNGDAVVLVPPGSVTVREDWPLGFRVLLGKDLNPRALHVERVDRPAQLRRAADSSFVVTDPMELRLGPLTA